MMSLRIFYNTTTANARAPRFQKKKKRFDPETPRVPERGRKRERAELRKKKLSPMHFRLPNIIPITTTTTLFYCKKFQITFILIGYTMVISLPGWLDGRDGEGKKKIERRCVACVRACDVLLPIAIAIAR
jgi:hypothetical protein